MGSKFDAVVFLKEKKNFYSAKDALIKSDSRDLYIVTTDFGNTLV